MPNFNLRVELHGATPQDYKTLSTEMMRRKVTDIIKSSTGKYYRLPSGEYYYSGPLNSDNSLSMSSTLVKLAPKRMNCSKS